MEKVMGLIKPKPTPQEQLREWQRKLRQETRNIDRQIRDIQREEKGVQKSIKEAAKRNDMGSARSLARELVNSRKVIERLYENKAQLNSISMYLGESVATVKAVGHIQKSTEVMKLVNRLLKAPEVAATMQDLQKEMMKSGVVEEMVSDSLEAALDSEDIEEEVEGEIDMVLSDIAGETIAQLPETARRKEKEKEKEKVTQPAVEDFINEQKEALAEGGGDDDAELEALRARLASVRS